MAGTSTIVVGFQDSVRNPTLWASPTWYEFAGAGVTVAETSGELKLTLLASTAGNNYSGYLSNSTYDLTADRCYIRQVEVPNVASAAEAQYVLSVDATHGFGFLIAGGIIQTRVNNAANDDQFPVTYSATTHAWLSMRESGGNVIFETAPSSASNPPVGGDWVTFATRAPVMAVTALKVMLGGGTYQSETSPGFIRYDGLNGATTSTAGDVFCLHESEWHPTEPQTNPLIVSVWG